MSKVDYVAQADAIIKAGKEARAEWQREHDRMLFELVMARQPVTIYGIRYIPDPEQP